MDRDNCLRVLSIWMESETGVLWYTVAANATGTKWANVTPNCDGTWNGEKNGQIIKNALTPGWAIDMLEHDGLVP